MALVVSAAPLGSLWSTAEPVVKSDKRVATTTSSSPSSGSSSRRTASTDSSPDPLDSSGSSFNTQHSGGSSGMDTSPKKSKQRRRHKGADIVLYVQDCAFTIHSHVLKHKCRVLYRLITQLRAQNAIGHLASGETDYSDGKDAVRGLGLILRADDQDDENRLHPRDHEFVLRQRDPLTSSRFASTTAAQPHARCPLMPRHYRVDRTSQSPSSRSMRFPKVRCVAHQRSDGDAHYDTDHQRPRATTEREEDFSPGKENYIGTLVTATTVRTQSLPRVALAPKLPFTSTTSSKFGPARRSGVGPSLSTSVTSHAAATPSPPRSISPQDPMRAAPDAFAVELVGASADAAATLIEFLYSGTTAGLDEGNAATVTRLCKWFCMEDHLLNVALIVRARNLQSVTEWMDILLCCTNLRSKARKQILVKHLLGRLVKLSPTQFRNVMDQMPLQRLAAIEDPDLLALVVTCMVNTVRSMEIWDKLTFALELWLFWSYRRPFAAAVPLDHPHPVTIRQPLSLLDFHQKFVSWQPVIRIDDQEVGGIDAYVKPTNLFTFGPFVFQIRLEPNRHPLISWRVVRVGTPSDAAADDLELSRFRPGLGPSFTVRGRLAIVYKCSPTGPLLQDEISVKYTHSEKNYAKWTALLTGPSAHARHVVFATTEPESEEKMQEPEPESSQEETAPLDNDSDAELDPSRIELHRTTAIKAPGPPGTSPPSTQPPSTNETSGSSDSSLFDPMTCHFSGQFFLWGHRLCNLYHFLLVSTLFYLVPRGSPRELFREAVQTRMRELPVETLVLVLQSDRLCVPDGETTLAVAVATLCFSDYGTVHYAVEQIRALFQCVRWCYVDLEQIMRTLEHARRELQLYELVEQQLRDHYNFGSTARRAPWNVHDEVTPYRATTTLVEFQIEAGDRSLSPSKFLYSQD